MTAPRDPEHVDPEAAAARSVRRRRHAAPDDQNDDEEYFRAQRAEMEAAERAEAERLARAQASDEQASQQAAQEQAAQDEAAQVQPVGRRHARDEPDEDSAPLRLATDPIGGDGGALPSSAPVEPATDDADLEPRRRHAAEGSSFRPQGWMIGVAATVVVGLVAWLVIALIGGDDKQTTKATPSETASTSAGPTPVDVASLPPLLCMGSSYITVDTGKTPDQLLADPKGAEEQFPGSKLSTIPPGCIAGVDTRDDVVLALGPYPSIEEACSAGKALQGVTFQAYAGSADLGLTKSTCA